MTETTTEADVLIQARLLELYRMREAIKAKGARTLKALRHYQKELDVVDGKIHLLEGSK